MMSSIGEVPASSSSSTGYIRRRFATAKHLATSRSSDAVIEHNRNQTDISVAYTVQNTDPISSGLNNGNFEANGGTTSSKDRRNLSEIDPPAFAKVLANKLEEIYVEQTKFDRILRLIKSVPNESDTDDSHSSAISYLMKCQWHSPRGGNCCSLDGDVTGNTAAAAAVLLSTVSGKINSTHCTDSRDDYAQGILENHCSRIGVDQNESRHTRRDSSAVRNKWKRETGSITSYDSGVATSLEQYSNLGIPPHLLDTIFQLERDGSKNLNPIDLALDNHRYHHHHHHHHQHKNYVDYLLQKDFPVINNVSDVSSNFDSGVSSTYEHLGRRFPPINDKVSNWMSKNPKVTSKICYNFNESFFPNITSGTPLNTPLISVRGNLSSHVNDFFPSPSYLVSRGYPPNMFSPLPESGILPCQNIGNWLEQQDADHHILSTNYCSSTVGVAGSELLPSRDQRPYKTSVQSVTTKDQQNTHQSSKLKSPGPLVIGYYIGNDPVPYRTQVPDAQTITLGQFKSLIAKKGPFRYFFKRYCDEFECGAVHEEITKDDVVLPLWEGKVVAKIEKSD